jgi:branched-subunit amino acid transport protein
VTWLALAIFATSNMATRTIGMFVLGKHVGPDAKWTRTASLVPLAIVTAVFAVQTFSSRGQLELDPRVLGVALGGVAAWRGSPMVVVVIIAAGTTAGLRALGL